MRIVRRIYVRVRKIWRATGMYVLSAAFTIVLGVIAFWLPSMLLPFIVVMGAVIVTDFFILDRKTFAKPPSDDGS